MTGQAVPMDGGFSDDTAVEVFNRLLDRRRPILLGLTGARYCGKSYFTSRTAELLGREKIPCAKVDVTERIFEQPEDLLDYLVAAFTDLHGRAARFPRYLLARSVLKDLNEKAKQSPQLDAVSCVQDLLRDPWRSDNLPNLIGVVAGAVAELNGLQGTGIRDGVTLITQGIFRTDAGAAIVRRPRAEWFAENELLERPGNPAAGLARLWEWRRGDSDLRRSADKVIAAAFLADVRESAQKGSWHGNYAILLDNADASWEGIRLVRALASVLGTDDRVTIAVTHRGRLLAEVGAVAGAGAVIDPMKVPVAGSAGWPPEGTRWWPLRLPDLDVASMRAMLRHATSWNEPACNRVATAVHRLTRGHLGATTKAFERLTAGSQPADGHIDLASLFDTDDLISHLTGRLDNDVRSALEICSAVRDYDHVGPLFRDLGISVTVARYQELWVPGRAGSLVLLPVLRRFLLRQFAKRDADAPDGWNKVFTLLANHARDGNSEQSEFYYRLALGQTKEVTQYLYEKLSNGDAAKWIELHKHVTLAPGNFGDEPYSTVLARHKKWAVAEERDMRTLADLVVRLWLAADPFRESPFRDDIRDAIQQDYRDLADCFPPADPLLRLEAARWG
jgi:hypothetical protein